jgi:predicted nucleic acid-binding protein
MIKPHLYLDTCIFLDVIYNRRDVSKQLLTKARHEVRQGNWLCSTSRWAIIELFDNMQEELFVKNLRIDGILWSDISRKLHTRRQKDAGLKKPDLDAVWNELHNWINGQFSFVEFKYPLTESMWNKAEDYCSVTNLSAEDSLHLAAAVEIGCNILVTTDQDFTTIANDQIKQIRTVPPSEVDMAIAKLNVKF